MLYNVTRIKWGCEVGNMNKQKKKMRILAFVLLIFFVLNVCAIVVPIFMVKAEDPDFKTYVKVTLDDEYITFDAQPYISGQRTMVPVRALMEATGATVDWNAAKKIVSIKSKEVSIKLTVDNTKAYINSKEVLLDVPAQIKENRVYVPLRFVSENMNFSVEWNGSEKTVVLVSKNITKEENKFLKAEITSEEAVFTFLNNNISYTKLLLRSPDRLVVDIKECVNTLVAYNMPENSSVASFRFSQYTINPNYVRLVLELKNSENYKIEVTGKKLKILFGEKASLTPETEIPKNPDSLRIVIDPGHGGSDPGACGYDDDGNLILKEKIPNLQVSLKLYELLKAAGFDVRMTRSTDVYVGLADRAQMANDVNADLFVSIHNNANDNNSVSGTMVMYAYDTPKTGMTISGKQFAQTIQKHLVKALPGTNDYGAVKNSSLAVVKRTFMPAVIVESLFISNESDRNKLLDENILNDIAVAVYNGILEILN